jgi:hypothetical protein
MKTDDLIVALARSADADADAPRAGPAAWALAVAAGAAAALLILWFGYGFSPTIADLFGEAMFWAKIAFGLGLAAAGLRLATVLGRPGARVGSIRVVPFAIVAALWLVAAWSLAAAPPEARSGLILGKTWQYCLVGIPLLSAGALAAMLVLLRRTAPTRPAVAGAAAGTFAAGLGSCVYALQCPELAAPFLATWYVLGALIPILAGAIVGSKVLSW